MSNSCNSTAGPINTCDDLFAVLGAWGPYGKDGGLGEGLDVLADWLVNGGG